MTRSLIGAALVIGLSLLFALHRKQQQRRAAERQSRLESRGYLPLSADDSETDIVEKLADTAPRLIRVVSLAALVFLLVAVVFLADMEPLVKRILAGTLALMGLVVVAWIL